MAIRKTLQIGNPKLRDFNEVVKEFDTIALKDIVQDLTDTMRDMHLIGMAAPQLGENIQLFITEPKETKHRGPDQSDELRVYINPRIIESSNEEIIMYEGCGSVLSAQLFGPVKRSKQITIEASDLMGSKFRFTADGILGRVILHEVDHIKGELFTDKVDDYKKLLSVDAYRELMRNSEDQVKKGVITLKKFQYI